MFIWKYVQIFNREAELHRSHLMFFTCDSIRLRSILFVQLDVCCGAFRFVKVRIWWWFWRIWLELFWLLNLSIWYGPITQFKITIHLTAANFDCGWDYPITMELRLYSLSKINLEVLDGWTVHKAISYLFWPNNGFGTKLVHGPRINLQDLRRFFFFFQLLYISHA